MVPKWLIRTALHTGFWGASYMVLLIYFSREYDLSSIDFIYTGLFHISIIAGVYSNLYLLLPHFFNRKKYLAYLFLFLVNLSLVTVFNDLLFSRFIDFFLPGYYFISYYSLFDIFIFHFTYVVLTTLIKLSQSWFELNHSRKEMAELQAEKAEAELKALKYQVNPHFLFNTLNGIYSLCRNKSDMAPEAIMKLSGIMRYILYEVNEEKVPLKKEIAILENYMDLEKMRLDEPCEVKLSIKGSLNNLKIAPLMLLPLMENCFKHGGRDEGGVFRMRFDVEAKGTEVHVEAFNLLKEESREMKEESGIGLDNMRKRLEMQYAGLYKLGTMSDKNAFVARLSVDLEDRS